MYCTQWCDGYAYCAADQLRPRDLVHPSFHTCLGTLLCAFFPTSLSFGDFRDPRVTRTLYAAPPVLTVDLVARLGLNAFDAWTAVDERVLARLAHVAHHTSEHPRARQLLREYALQHVPSLIAAVRGEPPRLPHRNVRYTIDVLPSLPLALVNNLVCRLDDKIHNIPLAPLIKAIMWGVLEKTTPRMCMRRASVKHIVATYAFRPAFHLVLDVTLLYGFLGCYEGAANPPSLLTSMAIIEMFRSAVFMNQAQFRSFVSTYELIVWMSWVLYTFDHVDRCEALRRTLDLLPNRARYVAAMRTTADRIHALLETHLRPVALMAIRRTHPERVRAAWGEVVRVLRAMHKEYKKAGPALIMRTMEPAFECMSTKWMTQMRIAIRDSDLPPAALPVSLRNELGNHTLLTQDELRAISLLATYNVAVAAQPLPPLLLLLGVSQDAINMLAEAVIKFTCRLGAKHAIKVDAALCIAHCIERDPARIADDIARCPIHKKKYPCSMGGWHDSVEEAAACVARCTRRDVMVIQQFLEQCAIAAGIFLAPLSTDVRDNQARAVRRRFAVLSEAAQPDGLGTFYFCGGCRVKLSQSVRHPNTTSLLCASMASIAHTAYYSTYVSHVVPGLADPVPIAKRTRRAGCTKNALVVAATGAVACSGCRSDDGPVKSWCALPPEHVNLIGAILYVNRKAYTICVQCGSFCSYVPSRWIAAGPVCSVHPPEIAAVLHAHAQSAFNVLNPVLTDFLNADDADTRPAPWMCEIDRCRDRCAAACDVVLLEPGNTLRFARLCADHYNTLHMYFGRGRCGPGVLRYHTLAQINEFVYAYCTHDHTRMRFLKRDGADHFFGEKKK